MARHTGTQPFFLGILGPPGSGKSTIASFWASVLSAGFGLDSVVLSSDDFYLTKSERVRRGYAWRGSPESHDIALFLETMNNIKAGMTPFMIPRFDPKIDDRGAPETIEYHPKICILEGWMIGKLAEMAFGSVKPFFDFLVYLEMSTPGARNARFRREAVIYRQSGGKAGFSPSEMSKFWSESLKPNIDKYVRPYARVSDLILEVGTGHRLRGAKRPSGSPQV
ncbi:hypothetical protein [Dehalogenimonas formicexedens]|uniref:hypothetical protein n=1 Tax=Dehalogenimonas formicexedens TaxID=1839801 RepID=UPI001CEF8872|nr:hypothetical protein [Dehalogenimonas formicexedens]